MDKLTPIFFYGTLLTDSTRQKALGRDVSGRTVYLIGWDIEMDKNDYPYLSRDLRGKVTGKVFDLTQQDIDKLDKWEAKYKRMKVTLSDGTKAETYEEAGH